MRYQVQILWKENKHLLQDNLNQVIARLNNTESQLKRKPEVKKLYENTLIHYIEKDYIRMVPKSDTVLLLFTSFSSNKARPTDK